MDANFLSIPIISCRDAATFQFVPLIPQVAQVAESRNDYIWIVGNNFNCKILVLNNKSCLVKFQRTIVSKYSLRILSKYTVVSMRTIQQCAMCVVFFRCKKLSIILNLRLKIDFQNRQ